MFEIYIKTILFVYKHLRRIRYIRLVELFITDICGVFLLFALNRSIFTAG